MSTCKQCGAEITEGIKFCPECGAKQEEVLFCSKCGAKLAEGMDFCGECGEPVKSVKPVQPSSGETGKDLPQMAQNFWQKLSRGQKSGIIAAVAIVVLGIFAGYSGTAPEPTPTPAAEPAPVPAIAVKAKDMMDDYIRDQGTAETKYKDKLVHITGKVIDKGQYSNSQAYHITLVRESAAGRDYDILLNMGEKNIKALNDLKYGDFVTAEGTCVGVVKQDSPTRVSVQIQVDKINE